MNDYKFSYLAFFESFLALTGIFCILFAIFSWISFCVWLFPTSFILSSFLGMSPFALGFLIFNAMVKKEVK